MGVVNVRIDFINIVFSGSCDPGTGKNTEMSAGYTALFILRLIITSKCISLV